MPNCNCWLDIVGLGLVIGMMFAVQAIMEWVSGVNKKINKEVGHDYTDTEL